MSGIAPFKFDQSGRVALVRSLPNSMNHWIADFEIVPLGHSGGGTKLLGDGLCLMLQFCRTHVRGRRVDQITDKGHRFG